MPAECSLWMRIMWNVSEVGWLQYTEKAGGAKWKLPQLISVGNTVLFNEAEEELGKTKLLQWCM